MQTAFLASQGGRLVDGHIADFGDYAAECDAFAHAACLADASDYGLLRVSGADAASFLHNQFSTNIQALVPGRGQVSTYNSPKGRMLANFFVWRAASEAPTFYLLLAADLTETIRKRLSMFVLRAKVVIDDISAAHAFLGICGAQALPLVSKSLKIGAPSDVHSVMVFEHSTALVLSPQRVLLLMVLENLSGQWAAWRRQFSPAGHHLWQRATILDGMSLITAATAERLIPQAANADALGALNFEKGCYPGQEVIARTRYLGRTKERLYLARCEDNAPLIGTPLYSTAFGEQACGLVVNAAPDRQGHILLASFQTAAADGPIHLHRPAGPLLALLPLPYELPAIEPSARPKL